MMIIIIVINQADGSIKILIFFIRVYFNWHTSIARNDSWVIIFFTAQILFFFRLLKNKSSFKDLYFLLVLVYNTMLSETPPKTLSVDEDRWRAFIEEAVENVHYHGIMVIGRS